MQDIKRILVASRMTKFDRKALQFGISLAKQFNAELFVIHVVHDPFGLEGWNLPVPNLEADYLRELQKAKKSLDDMIAQERAGGLGIKELVREGEPVQEILRVVKEEKIDLLILLAHEEGKLEHFLFGHANDQIVHKLPCTILLVKKEVNFA